jgi:hypothetical protein
MLGAHEAVGIDFHEAAAAALQEPRELMGEASRQRRLTGAGPPMKE